MCLFCLTKTVCLVDILYARKCKKRWWRLRRRQQPYSWWFGAQPLSISRDLTPPPSQKTRPALRTTHERLWWSATCIWGWMSSPRLYRTQHRCKVLCHSLPSPDSLGIIFFHILGVKYIIHLFSNTILFVVYLCNVEILMSKLLHVYITNALYAKSIIRPYPMFENIESIDSHQF